MNYDEPKINQKPQVEPPEKDTIAFILQWPKLSFRISDIFIILPME
jgi:hypothetical protein